MTNFDFLKKEKKFNSFADVAVSAEKILPIDYAASVLNCRRAMEFAVKWMYSVDGSLVVPWDDKLVSLMSTDEFRDIVDADLLLRMHFIRGNTFHLHNQCIFLRAIIKIPADTNGSKSQFLVATMRR